jgi:hypothetical protein
MGFMIFFGEALIVGIVYLSRWSRGYTGGFGGDTHEGSPLDILRKKMCRR